MISRINKIIEANNMSTTQFADCINIQRPSMSHIIAGRNNPSLDFVTKVLVAFPTINPDWLIFGKGNMYRNSDKIESQKDVQNFSIPKDSDLNLQDSIELDLFSTNNESPKPNNIEISKNEVEDEKIVSIVKDEDPIPYFKNSSSSPELNKMDYSSDEHQIIDSNASKQMEKRALSHREISKIVFFYTDKTFSEYFPE